MLRAVFLDAAPGGVVGGAFNAFIAPVIFNSVIEYPLVLVLAAFARPIGPRTLPLWRWLLFVVAIALSG